MEDSLSKAIAKLRQASSRLNEITDQSAETIRRVEEFLNKECSIGVSAWARVLTEADDDGTPTWVRDLGYCRLGDRFRIFVGEMDFHGGNPVPETATSKPWSDCARDVKLETFLKLPELLQEIVRQVEQRVKEAERVSSTVSAMMQSLQKKGG